MAERRLHGLQRVLGVNALFSTAYGNVGSSIYYALGVTAAFALGLTPLVFLIAGLFYEVLHFRHLWAYLGLLAGLDLIRADSSRLSERR